LLMMPRPRRGRARRTREKSWPKGGAECVECGVSPVWSVSPAECLECRLSRAQSVSSAKCLQCRLSPVRSVSSVECLKWLQCRVSRAQSDSSAKCLQCLKCRVSLASCVSLACICVVSDTDRQMKCIIPPIARVPPSATGHHG